MSTSQTRQKRYYKITLIRQAYGVETKKTLKHHFRQDKSLPEKSQKTNYSNLCLTEQFSV